MLRGEDLGRDTGETDAPSGTGAGGRLRRVPRAGDGGGTVSCLEGGEGPGIIWSHANGFNAGTYRPLLEALAADAHVIACDARGHGETTLPADPARLLSWRTYYDDLVRLLDSLPAGEQYVLGGHSMGGTASLFAAAARPGRVRAVLLAEPVLIRPRDGLALFVARTLGLSYRARLVRAAAGRRPRFPDPDAAYASYRSRAAFRRWPDAWLRAYVDTALAETPEGDWRLRCTPAWESRTFASAEPWPWRAMRRVRAPVTVLLAEHGSTCGAASRAALRRRRPGWCLQEVPETDHFLPMERPDMVREHLLAATRPGQRT